VGSALNGTIDYTGKKQPSREECAASRWSPYLPSQALVTAVNLAKYLGRPLLLKGEPGSGKTKLAQHVAFELGLPFEQWYVKSTSHARDGLYIYDAVARLRDSQLDANGRLPPAVKTRIEQDPFYYVRWGALGKALRRPERTVVLIDEIDKADIDFPNDLLLELDESTFEAPEVGEWIIAQASAPPIVFITSNDEKDLPDAFLRRCLFHYVGFPNQQQLAAIVRKHLPNAPEELVQAAVRRFEALREEMKTKVTAGKSVSTAELLDWMRVLLRHYTPDSVPRALEAGRLLYPSVLLKSWDDQQRFAADDLTAEQQG
jgi:MoxR-like ATPase